MNSLISISELGLTSAELYKGVYAETFYPYKLHPCEAKIS
jgi:hypothetical protein